MCLSSYKVKQIKNAALIWFGHGLSKPLLDVQNQDALLF
jgi:hypothetical protein